MLLNIKTNLLKSACTATQFIVTTLGQSVSLILVFSLPL